jgi:hypothetical protein
MLSEAYVIKQFYSAGTEGTEPLCLSLFVSPGSFAYAISTHNFKTAIELCHVQLTDAHAAVTGIKDSTAFLIQNYLLDRKKFEKVNVTLLNTDFAMIPEAYAAQEALKPLLNFTVGGAPAKNIVQHTLNGITFCFTPDNELAMHLERAFPNASVKHTGAVSMQLLFSHHALKNCNLFLNIHDGFIELAAKNKNDLLFYNIFNYGTNEDVLYYLLFMMEQFALDPLVVKLGIAGQRPVDDELMQQIKKYIRQVVFCAPDPSITLSGELAQLPGHYYFTILNQHLCE